MFPSVINLFAARDVGNLNVHVWSRWSKIRMVTGRKVIACPHVISQRQGKRTLRRDDPLKLSVTSISKCGSQTFRDLSRASQNMI